MDVDAVIRRAPELALIDELAHTNAPGMRNEKRYEDIDEVLAAGIDVISTVNVQHLESLNDSIAELTDVRVRETFPDRILEEADEVVLVDLTPEALQERLRAGKVYPRERAEVALANFFRADKLSALRELALREVAEDVEARRQQAAVLDPLSRQAVAERVLALVTPEPRSQRLLRRAWRSAERLGGQLDALWVHRPGRAADRGGAGLARRAAPARRDPRRALPGGGGRRPRADDPPRRRRARDDLRVRRDAGRVAAARDPARLARLGARARAARGRHPRGREPRRPGEARGMNTLDLVLIVVAGALLIAVGLLLVRRPHGREAPRPGRRPAAARAVRRRARPDGARRGAADREGGGVGARPGLPADRSRCSTGRTRR